MVANRLVVVGLALEPALIHAAHRAALGRRFGRDDEAAFAACRDLAAKEGIFAGSSSGAGLAGARQLIEKGARGNFVIIIPDRAERYFSEGLFQ